MDVFVRFLVFVSLASCLFRLPLFCLFLIAYFLLLSFAWHCICFILNIITYILEDTGIHVFYYTCSPLAIRSTHIISYTEKPRQLPIAYSTWYAQGRTAYSRRVPNDHHFLSRRPSLTFPPFLFLSCGLFPHSLSPVTTYPLAGHSLHLLSRPLLYSK